MTGLGGRGKCSQSARIQPLGSQPIDPNTALHSGDDDDTEREYDRLRDLARAEADKRGSCLQRVRARPASLCPLPESTPPQRKLQLT